ncbi:FAD-binding oxidoreductase [Streptomyces sp. NBC_00006]|uniref:2Fe-2S iron-sulfur cluster-binding protein n=1 Tax=Streptomyces sp. NBC_00006 TaxID=2975619 RepID=UPI0022512E4B|nr:2Fe-2S iron-sulfur cluster-binding protein [Streptomyces sp. NBC_00006]MCX5529181.1 FAD-binding oxidoreductase [Streptomyces sp. NBC_00006]
MNPKQHASPPDPPHRLTTVEELESTIGRPAAMITRKQVRALDEGSRAVLARCPVAAFGYRDASGAARTTFVGGAPGFAHVHSPTEISFAVPGPEVARGPVSAFFLLPGVGEVLRVNGTAAGRRGGEVFVEVAEAYVHCAQAVIRSRLWEAPAAAATTEPVAGEGPLAGPGVADFLAAAPFLALSSWDTDGGSDTSPRGERQPVARILDGRRLVIADRRGNKRADTLHNLLQDDRLSLAALVPGRSGVLHVRGCGAITDDLALRETMALRGVPPHLALVIDVEHAEVTGSAAVADARLWDPGRAESGEAPDMMALGSAHLAANSAESGRSSAWLIKAFAAIPGVSRLMRKVMDRGYRFALQKEGYEEVRIPAGTRTGEPSRPSEADGALRQVRVAEVRQETPTARTLVLRDASGEEGALGEERLSGEEGSSGEGRLSEEERPFDFRPGQFFTLIVDVAGHPVRRAYSASSAPGATHLDVTVKQVDGGHFSTHVHRDLRVGDRLAVRGPSGTFHTRDEPQRHLVLIAAGSGITPMMSMIRSRLADPAGDGRIALLYSSRTHEEIIFADELARLEKEHPERFTVTHVLTRRDGRLDARGVRHWVTTEAARALPDGAHHYLCGPEALMDTVQGVMRELGVPDERVHQERFTAAATPAAVAGPQQMRVEEGGAPVGATIVEPGQTLLDAGLAARLPMPYSCTVGNCGDCAVRLRDGDVTQAEPNCLTPEQRADGYVLACVSCPLSNVTLDIGPQPPLA